MPRTFHEVLSFVSSAIIRIAVLAVLGGLSILGVLSAQTTPIAIYGTGVVSPGVLAADGVVDNHYTLFASADPAYPGPSARVVNSTDIVFAWGWVSNGPNSKWIAPRADPGNGNAPGNYTYRTTFDLTGYNPATAMLSGQWATDDSATMKLNGATVGTSVGGGYFASFTVNTGFISGVNTLDFVVYNNAPNYNATGLRVDISGTVGSGAQWYNGSWTKRKLITVDYSKVSANLTNFPMLFSVTDSNLKTVAYGGYVGKADGTDILFTAADGTTKLSHHFELYNASTGQVIAWVKVPTLSSTSPTSLYIYYGNSSAADQQTMTAVWDANYKGVWHLGGSTLNASDSTANAVNGSISGAYSSGGKVGNGGYFNGSSHINFGNPSAVGITGSITMSAWIRTDAFPPPACCISTIFDKGYTGSTGNEPYFLRFDTYEFQPNTVLSAGTDAAWTNHMANWIVPWGTGQWHYVAGQYNGSAWLIYVDGAQVASSTDSQGPVTNTKPLLLGAADINGTISRFFTGVIDEARLSNIARSANWILTEFRNQNSPVTFYAVGSQESGGGGCTYSISPASQQFTASGGNGTVTVTAGGGCAWTAVSNTGWATITAGSSGSGNGSVNYSVAANTGGIRSGTMTVAGQTFTVSQSAASPLSITTASPLPGGTFGGAYSPVTFAASGGTPPYSWSFEDPPTYGNLLPSGLTLSGAVLSGTPTRGGQTYGFWIRVTDSLNATTTKDFTLAIGPTEQPIYGPSRLEVGLSFMPFNDYRTGVPASSKFPQSCPSGSSVRGCFQTVLAELRAQGVTGIRIFFQLCGPDSTPLLNCGQNFSQVRYNTNDLEGDTESPPGYRKWIDRVKDFFWDVSNAGIQNITLTPAHLTGLHTELKQNVITPIGGSSTVCPDAQDVIYFYETAPLGYRDAGGGEYHPIGANNNQGYDCSPINPFFVGWQNQYDVINAMLAAAKEVGVTIAELDFEQELNVMVFPALARFIVDNTQGEVGGDGYTGQPNVRDALRYYMDLYDFDTGRVTWSAPWSNSSLAGVNCTSVYGGYARTMEADQIASVIGGGLIGIPNNRISNDDTGHLSCDDGNGAYPYGMYQMPSYGSQPNILDVHLRPCVAGPGLQPHCLVDNTLAAVTSEAILDFNAIVNYIARFPVTTTVMLGETHSNTDNAAGQLCEGGTLNAPAQTVSGYNQSSLKGTTNVVFRPWMQLQHESGDCFKHKGNQRVNFLGGGPYTPTQQ